MTNFPDFENIENMGGNYESFLFIPINKINTFPDALNHQITTAISLTSGSSWYNGKAIINSLSFENSMNKGINGTSYPISLKGFVPKLTAEYLSLFAEMAESLFVAIITDNNGTKHCIGSKKSPLRFSFSRSTDSSPSGKAGHSFEFYAENETPCPIYNV